MTVRRVAALAGVVAALACGRDAPAERPPPAGDPKSDARASTFRVAVFNTALSREDEGVLRSALASGADPQARDVATILQVVRPDVVLLLEVDRDPAVADAFVRQYLEADLGVAEGPLRLSHRVQPPTNTGVPSGLDLDRDGTRDGPGDALGFGAFPGQYGMLVLSRYPLALRRCWGELLWRDTAAPMPDDSASPAPADWYGPEAKQRLPLSSKNHCDITVTAPGGPLQLLISHPTPPVFDGSEDRNGLRNAAEIGVWSDWLDGGDALGAPLPPGARFVLAGDLNADPHDGEADHAAIARLLSHPRLSRHSAPESRGGVAAAARDGGPNRTHAGPAQCDTADFPEGERGPGNLRTDYVLPSSTLTVADAGVFWPAPGEPYAPTVACSDHRLVWVDLEVPDLEPPTP
ncbi:MAG: endonuclease/exonuclease/phosphatase family protein [Myxococcota bacterium]